MVLHTAVHMTSIAPTAPLLDTTGLTLLRLLAEDGRASYQSLPDEVGLSRPAVRGGVRACEEGGIMKGHPARLDRARIGRPITAFVTVRYPASDHGGTERCIL